MYSQPNLNPQSQKYKLPPLDFISSPGQLSKLKKKMLSHAYDLQIHSKQKQSNRRQTTATTSRYDGNSDSYSNSNSNNVYNNYVSINSETGDRNSRVLYIPSYIDINMAHIEKQRKNKMELAQQYQRQMEKKNERIKQQKQRRLSQERKMIQNLKKMDIIEEDRHRLAEKQYKMQVEQQLSAAKDHKIHEQEIRNRQKQQYNKKYGGGQTLWNSQVEDNTKLNKFKQHYENVNRIQYRIEKNYLDQWSPLIKQQEHQKQRLIQAGIYQAHQFQKNLYPKLQKAEFRHKTELKQALQQQIKQKQAMKSIQKLRYKSEAHTTNNYKNQHHPIINPIDFKIAHDNKKILKQLQEEQQIDNKISGLARNGSLVVLDRRSQRYN